MNNPDPIPPISESNLSKAWSRLFLQIMENPGTEIAPISLSISGFQNGEIAELPTVREALDEALRGIDSYEVNTVANTIFPQSMWRACKGDRHRLYDMYRSTLPRIAALAPVNGKGTYFSRLIAFDVNPKTGERLAHVPSGAIPQDGNQLEHIISTIREAKVKRDSALQAIIFDPARDHSPSPYQSFPCMQHVFFIKSEQGGLMLNAIYATQQVFRKAYGNYLGLCRLGLFVASEARVPLDRVNVYIGSERLGGTTRDGRTSKSSPTLGPVIAVARDALKCGDKR